jgi:hypothetical protein
VYTSSFFPRALFNITIYIKKKKSFSLVVMQKNQACEVNVQAQETIAEAQSDLFGESLGPGISPLLFAPGDIQQINSFCSAVK